MPSLTDPFKRCAIDRGYRILAFASAVEFIIESLDAVGKRRDGEMALRHLGRAIDEETQAMLDDLEKQAQAARREAANG
jgi:hypothetical protein